MVDEHALHDDDYDTDLAVGDDGARTVVQHARGASSSAGTGCAARSVCTSQPDRWAFRQVGEAVKGPVYPAAMSSPADPTRPDRAASLWLVAVGVVLFALSAVLSSAGLSHAEWSFFETFNEVPAPLSWFLVAVMHLGDGEAAIIVPVVFLVLRRFTLALVTGFTGPVSWMLAQVGKSWQIRGRPVDLVEVFVPGGEATGAGFPSGHTAVAVGLAVALWPFAPRWLRAVLVLLAVAVAFARMHVGVHLPLDLVGGAAVGLVVAGCVRLLISRR